MNVLLSVLVLAWGIIPPGVQHAHAGGSDPAHRHDDRREEGHHGSHGHHSHDGHHDHARESDASLVAEYVRHIHWRLLGVEFSMPVSEEPVERDDDRGTLPPEIVRATNEVVAARPASPLVGRVIWEAFRAPSLDVVWSLERIPRGPNVVTSTPLCDSARLERSGVLLV